MSKKCIKCQKNLDKRNKVGYCKPHSYFLKIGVPLPKLRGDRTKIVYKCKQCNKAFKSYKCREGVKKYCSRKCLALSKVGKSLPVERVRKSALGHSGSKSHFWKGGVTKESKLIRGSYEYKLWREAVFKRDNWTCVWCGIRGSVALNADHIKPFAHYPELRFAIDNGRTLCVPCHKTTDTYLSKGIKK